MKAVLKSVKKFTQEADMVLLALCVAASLIGLLLVASATYNTAIMKRSLFVQAGAIGIGVVLFVLFSLIDLDDLTEYWKLILVFNILFVFSTFFFGITVNGNKSWLEIPLIGLRVQPAEIVKISFAILLAFQMYNLRDSISSIKAVALLGAHLALMVGLILIASDDMGMSVVYIVMFVCMTFAAGVKIWWFLGAAGGIAAAFPYIWRSLSDYQRRRIMVVIDNSLDPLGTGYQAIRSKLALGSGKLFGQGLFNGTQTQRGSLPAKSTDFIYAVCGEELGMIGCIIVLGLLVAIIVRCLYVASRAKNGMGSLVCVGIAAMLIFQTFENIGMCIGLTPVIGITLPFVSSGGTSVITMFAAMGIVSGVKMRPMPDWLKTTGY